MNPDTPNQDQEKKGESTASSQQFSSPDNLAPFIQKMQAEGISQAVIESFSHYYRQLASGVDSFLHENDILPAESDKVMAYEDLHSHMDAGNEAMAKTARIVLNGGLGTTMKLTKAKSLIEVKEGITFLDIIISQSNQASSFLCLMNSFSTHDDTVCHLNENSASCFPLNFIQNKFPKIMQNTLQPAQWSTNPKMEWNPPGHGDIYLSLHASGILSQLLDQGVRYAFISNADNVGATIDPILLGYFASNKLPFMMEVAQRNPSDAKGGHLARYADNGRWVLREVAQCTSEDKDRFQDINTHRFFNTNNIWIDLKAIKDLMDHQGMMQLPMIVNPKTIDPADDNSPPVYQIETAMGSAISIFDDAAAVCVPRTRFVPVKNTTDLLVVRSDRYHLTDQHQLVQQTTSNNIKVDLDPKFYKGIDQFNTRFKNGTPSLQECNSLSIHGDVHFGKNIKIQGNVKIINNTQNPMQIPNNTKLKEQEIVTA